MPSQNPSRWSSGGGLWDYGKEKKYDRDEAQRGGGHSVWWGDQSGDSDRQEAENRRTQERIERERQQREDRLRERREAQEARDREARERREAARKRADDIRAGKSTSKRARAKTFGHIGAAGKRSSSGGSYEPGTGNFTLPGDNDLDGKKRWWQK